MGGTERSWNSEIKLKQLKLLDSNHTERGMHSTVSSSLFQYFFLIYYGPYSSWNS